MIQLTLSEALNILKPLALFILGMTIYSIFTFKFYKFLSRKDIFKLNLNPDSPDRHWFIKSILKTIFYLLEYIIFMPVLIFFWFSILALLLSFLAKNQTIETILLVSIAVVGTVRFTAYYKEDLSRDLAKMLPFALLGVFLVDISFFNIETSLSLVKQIPSQLTTLLYYLIFIVLLEFILRVIFFFFVSEEEEVVDSKKD